MRLSKQLNTLTTKDMGVLREADSIKTQVKLPPRGVLRDYSLQHRVVMEWGIVPMVAGRKVRPFRLKVDQSGIVLDWSDFIGLSREGFFEYSEPLRDRDISGFGGDKVTLSQNLNEEAKRDIMFILELNNMKVILDWEEMQRYGRLT